MVYLIGKRLIPPIVRLYLKKVIGLDNIPTDRGFILAANHSSYMDHFLIMSTLIPYLNKKIHFLAKKEHFDGILTSLWHKWAGAVPIDRQGGGKEALRWAIKALKEGKIIAMYPEGTRTLTGKMQKGKTGVARLSLKSRVLVVPIGLEGTFNMLPKGKYFPRPNKAIIRIGKPISFEKYYGKENNKKVLRFVTDTIMKEIAKLAKQEYDLNE